MRKYFLLLLLVLAACTSCDPKIEDQTLNRAESIFGIKFNNDWTTTENASIAVYGQNMLKTQILAYIKTDSVSYTTVLNEAEGCNVTLSYDVPKNYSCLYAAGTSLDGRYYIWPFEFGAKDIYIGSAPAMTRAAAPRRVFSNPTLGEPIISYERQRGYPGFENEILYESNCGVDVVSDYDNGTLNAIRALVFEYLPNGRSYNNLPKIKESGYYNENCYAITTGDEPIIVSQIYKNDGGYHEVETCDLYYYYFQGDLTVDEIKALPKYRALSVNEYMNADDELKKHRSYELAYWESEDHQFPKGYKIGFMLRSKFGQSVKQGELYFDGRLNNKINKHGHFKSSGFGDNDPRMCWMTVNDMMLMCCEAGTDADFNDVIFEVEGGVEKIIIPIPPVYNFYTYLYEDRNLGDYDMNDVVIQGQRIDVNHVQWTIMATGANDELYIENINGNIINNSKEIHTYFGIPRNQFANVHTRNEYPVITEVVTVPPLFSFVNDAPYIRNASAGYNVMLATAGQDPHAIMVPYDVLWPIEKTCVKDAYLRFNEWGENAIISTDWYTDPVMYRVVK